MCMCASLLTVLLRLNMPDCLLLSAVSWCLSMLRSCCICLPLPILLHIMHQAEACCFIASDTEYSHHPCPRTSARVWALLTEQPSASKQNGILLSKDIANFYRFIEVKHQCMRMLPFLDCGGKISSKNLNLGMFGNIGFASFPIDWCELWWLSTLHSIAIELSNVSNGLLSDHIVTRSLKWKFEISHSINESYKRLLSCHIIVHFHQKQNKWNSYGVSP